MRNHGITYTDRATVGGAGMARWGINAIRLPMNEDCWLGLNGANPKTSGAIYQSAFVTFVEQLLASGFVVVLDLHWTSHTTGVRARGPVAACKQRRRL